MEKFKDYFQAVNYLEGLPSMANGIFLPGSAKDPAVYLERTRFFLGLIGNPQNKLKFIHVTGTSGKGSVSALVANMLSSSGQKTGLFSSPFVTTSIEKISIDGKYISHQEFTETVEFFKPKIEEAIKGCPYGRPTYFEIFFVLSLYYFAKKKCDWVVLEVGCGGRFDATNVVENTEIAVITNIALDHIHVIGDTLEKIAHEKAGIVKKNCRLFTAEENPKLLKIFKRECQEKGAGFEMFANHVKSVRYEKGGMSLVLEQSQGNEIFSRLWGEHQIRNINLAISVARGLGISERHIREGIEATVLPCRFETVQENPRVVLDGAHNPSKMESTAENIKKLNFDKLVLVVGISQTKDAENSLKEIFPLADRIVATTISFGKPLEPEDILEVAKIFSKEGAVLETERDMWKALEKAMLTAGPDDLVLVTGSFYLAGELRKKWFSEAQVLERRKSF